MAGIKLSEYLEKVGLSEKSLMDLSAIERLNEVYKAHIVTFSYSNSRLRLTAWQHPLQRNLSFEDYESELFESGTGYCYQHAALLQDVLVQLGYTVEFCEAYVLMGEAVNSREIISMPPTHLVLKLTMDDTLYLLDPGLGSNALRQPILITGGYESIKQPPDELRFYHLEQEKLFVLEKMTERGWLRLIQTDLCPISRTRIQFNLMRLEQHPTTLAIRDEKFVMGRVLQEGRRFLFCQPGQQLKYAEKPSENKEETITDYTKATKLAQEKFNTHTTTKELKKCCTLSKNKRGFSFFDTNPKQAWTVEFPLDKKTRFSMLSNLG